MGQHARAVQPLPPERIKGQAVVLVPADLDGEEILQAGFFDQLRQVPGIAKDIRQPEHRAFGSLAEIFAEEGPPQEELAGQRFGAAQVAVGLDPHAAHRFPGAAFHGRADEFEQGRVILADIIVKLGLRLGKDKIGELLGKAHGVIEGAPGLAPGLGKRPQPGHVDVGVAGSGNIHRHGLAGMGDTCAQIGQGGGQRGVKVLAKGLAQVDAFEGIIQAGEQLVAGGMVFVEHVGDAQRGAGQGMKLARGGVYFHHEAGAHQQLEALIGAHAPAPAVQRQDVFAPVAEFGRDAHFLVVAVDRRGRLAVDIGQGFRMAEIVSDTDRQEKRAVGGIPIRRQAETGAQGEIEARPAPHRIGGDAFPAGIVQIGLDGRRRGDGWRRQLEKAPIGQGQAAAVNERLDQVDALGNFIGGPTLFVIHIFPLTLSDINHRDTEAQRIYLEILGFLLRVLSCLCVD